MKLTGVSMTISLSLTEIIIFITSCLEKPEWGEGNVLASFHDIKIKR